MNLGLTEIWLVSASVLLFFLPSSDRSFIPVHRPAFSDAVIKFLLTSKYGFNRLYRINASVHEPVNSNVLLEQEMESYPKKMPWSKL